MPIPDPETFVRGYRVTRADWKVEDIPAKFEDDGSPRIIWLKLKPHPTDPYRQMTPLMAAGISAESDWLAHLFNRNFLASDGRPGTLITIDSQLNPVDAQEIKNKFMGGPLRAGMVSVVEAAGVQVHDMSANPRDIQWDDLMKISKEELLMAFGVPESVMGNASGRTFDNADAERENFWIDTMVPHTDAIASGFDLIFDNDYDDLTLAYDYSSIDVLQRMENRRREQAQKEVELGLMTPDEYFTLVGKKVWDVAGTKSLWNKFGVPIAPDPKTQEQVEELKPVTMPDQPQMPGMPGAGPQAVAGGPNAPALPARVHPALIASRAALLSGSGNAREASSKSIEKKDQPSSDDEDVIDVEVIDERKSDPRADRSFLEGVVMGIMDSWDDRQAQVIPERLDHVKSRKGTRHWDGPEEKNLLRRLLDQLNYYRSTFGI